MEVDVAPPLVVPDLLILALRRATLSVALALQDAMGSDDIRAGQFALLELLHQRPGARPGEIGPKLRLHSNKLRPMLDELTDRGLVMRLEARDRRASALFLTAAGEAMLSRCRVVYAAHEMRMAERLGPDGRRLLTTLLQRLDMGSERDLSEQEA